MDATVAVVSVVDPEMPVKVALMVVWPAAAAEVIPAALMVATAVSEEFQAARLVRSWVALFDKVPVAVNCRVVPTMLVTFAGVTAMETNAADVNATEPDTFPEVAVMVAEPAAIAVTAPFEPSALLTEAAPPFDELHTTDAVRFRKEPSENEPAAVNCVVVPEAILAFDGVTVMEVRVTGVDSLPPHPARIRTVIHTTKTLFTTVSKMDNKRLGLTIVPELKVSSILIR
jgi:hypothetical protein